MTTIEQQKSRKRGEMERLRYILSKINSICFDNSINIGTKLNLIRILSDEFKDG
jgi:hypothetical protein